MLKKLIWICFTYRPLVEMSEWTVCAQGGTGAPTHWQCVATLHCRCFPHSLPDHTRAHRSERQLPLYLSPSHPAPSPLAVLSPYLPLCAPSQPIETIKTPCTGEGAMIIAGQIPSYDTTKMGFICPIHI